MARATKGNNAQFTYDFGIAIAQSTVTKLTRLTGVTLSLASAYYALKNTSEQYVSTLRENTLRFGGVLSTMKAIEQAQDRLIKGQSYFDVDDQLRGMNQLMASGIDVRKNLDFINKAAHATGKSFASFSGAITSAISGNMGQLVEMGFMTQRATRMFDKYAANTVQRQQAIMNFIRNHKGLLSAIKNDFETVQDQMRRINELWHAFLRSVMGKPNDPNSFYGQIVATMKMVAESLAKNLENIKRIGFIIGHTLGWVVRQVGKFVVWLGGLVKKQLGFMRSALDNYEEFTRSLIVWLEFWKVRIVDFFKEYGGLIKTVVKWLLIYKVAKMALMLGTDIIGSVVGYGNAIKGLYKLQMRYITMQGPLIGKTARYLQSLAVYMPYPFRRAWVASGKYIGLTCERFKLLVPTLLASGRSITAGFVSIFKSLGAFFKGFYGLLFKSMNLWRGNLALMSTGLVGLAKGGLSMITGGLTAIKGILMAIGLSNPIGWIILGVAAVVLLYKKFAWFRILVNKTIKTWTELVKLLWNIVYGAMVYMVVGIKKIWNFFVGCYGAIKKMWAAFKDTTVGKFIDKYIVQPLSTLFKWIVDAFKWVLKSAGKLLSYVNKDLAKNINGAAKDVGMPTLALTGADEKSFDADNDKDYLTMDSVKGLLGGGNDSNPVSDAQAMANVGSVGGGVSNTMYFQNGAIQIIVDKGSNIDEETLARKVKQVIKDIEREHNMRGGTA